MIPETYRRTEILVYPNVTYARNLEADSFVVVLRPILERLARSHPHFRFSILLPTFVDSLDLPNVRQFGLPLPTYPNTMRTHFDAPAILDAIDWRNESYDVVWTHLPEQALALRNLLYGATNERPEFVGYCHWFEVPENTSYAETMFEQNLAGLNALNVCGVNSEWLRQLVLAYAEEIYSEERQGTLCEILVPQYLGTEPPPDRALEVEPEPGLLLFNHRANAYTGYDFAVSAFDALWDRREDFRVAFTIADVPDRPWALGLASSSREEYLVAIAKAWAGVGCFDRYSAWSVSVTDGLSVGVPYVLPSGLCYPEMVGEDWPLLYRPGRTRSFLDAVENLLDRPDLRADLSHRAVSIAERFSWDERVGPFGAMLEHADRNVVSLRKATPKYEKAKKLVEAGYSKREITKAMGWGVGIPWTNYRTLLRRELADSV